MHNARSAAAQNRARDGLCGRFRRVNYGNLEIQITVDDPKAYTKPWTVTLKLLLAPDTELLDYICLENEKDLRRITAEAK